MTLRKEISNSLWRMDELAKHITSIVPIAEDRLSLVLDSLVEKRFAKKEHLLYANGLAKEVYFMLKGCVRTYICDRNGVEHNITFAMENWWFGDLQSFIQGQSASFNLQALEDTSVLSITKDKWDALLWDIPEFIGYTRVLFRNTMFSHEQRIIQNLSFTAEERYDFFLEKYPGLSHRISQKHIASYIGITPEFLSMIRSKRRW